jgi:chemotaxis protein MotA
MDPASIIGLVLAFGSIFGAMIMEGGNPAALMVVPALILVMGGTIGACMAGGMLTDTIGVGKQFAKALMAKPTQSGGLVEEVVALADKARREGLLALEDATKDVQDPFLQRGLQLAIDGTDGEELREILEAEVFAKRTEDKAGAKFFADAGGFAPTIGIIGTVIGLVHVLESLSEPAKLGHLIAGAFVATLWGVMLANVVWLPLCNRLKRVSELECAQMELTIEGILAIQGGANPRLVAQKLHSLMGSAGAQSKQKAA